MTYTVTLKIAPRGAPYTSKGGRSDLFLINQA